MEKRFVYADNAATTAVSNRVLMSMLPYMTEHFGNPSGSYSIARKARMVVEAAREKIALSIGCEPSEIYFTSGGTESNNWALKNGKNHIITTNIEHHAVLHTCEYLEKQGTQVTYLPVNGNGFITSEQVKNVICRNTSMVSVMYANNEIGTIMPIKEIGEMCHENKVVFHTDGVQAVGKVPIDVKKQKIDMLSCSGHKLHGPKGIGFLYVGKDVPLEQFLFGGDQERGFRAGTENVPAIVGLGEAVLAACENMAERTAKTVIIRDKLIDGLLEIDGCRLNGSRERRICGNVNVCFDGVEAETVLLMLDAAGICASGGSACATWSDKPSHVLLALGLSPHDASGSVRFTISDETTNDDVDYIIKSVSEILKKIRRIK